MLGLLFVVTKVAGMMLRPYTQKTYDVILTGLHGMMANTKKKTTGLIFIMAILIINQKNIGAIIRFSVVCFLKNF